MDPNIILPQTPSLINSLLFVLGTATVIFTIKFWLSIIQLKRLQDRPSILIIEDKIGGSLLNKIVKGKISNFPTNKNIKFGISNLENKFQFIEIPIFSIKDKSILELFDKINLKGMILSLDHSKSLEAIENEIKKIGFPLDSKPKFLVVNELDKLDLDGKSEEDIFENKEEDIELLRKKLINLST